MNTDFCGSCNGFVTHGLWLSDCPTFMSNLRAVRMERLTKEYADDRWHAANLYPTSDDLAKMRGTYEPKPVVIYIPPNVMLVSITIDLV